MAHLKGTSDYKKKRTREDQQYKVPKILSGNISDILLFSDTHPQPAAKPVHFLQKNFHLPLHTKNKTSSCCSIVDGGYILPPRGVEIKKNNTGQGFNKVPPVSQVCVVEPRASVDSLPVQSNRCSWSESYFWNAWGKRRKGDIPCLWHVPKFSPFLLQRLTNI
ncbi:hypothetical protein CEXT_637671 [Caerostris extrusa]|uniref:Uncharacterized protein n=1 Tax=Caerostris extrusa TaxID=172846 RepID=A0AAV4MHB0_CAEEX|nr:hypothetical protein CEXT_637671 [Caerostris extrusa]